MGSVSLVKFPLNQVRSDVAAAHIGIVTACTLMCYSNNLCSILCMYLDYSCHLSELVEVPLMQTATAGQCFSLWHVALPCCLPCSLLQAVLLQRKEMCSGPLCTRVKPPHILVSSTIHYSRGAQLCGSAALKERI